MLFSTTSGLETTSDTLVLERKTFTSTFICLFFSFFPLLASSPSSPPLSHGLRELLAIWMLALYCEHSLIAPLLPTASQASQHGAWVVCLICHTYTEKRREMDSRIEPGNWQSEYKRLWKLLEASSHIICFLSPSLSVVQLLVLLTVGDNQWCAEPDFTCLILK